MDEARHILICGDKGVGKSTLIRRLLADCPLPRYGFITKRTAPDAVGFHAIYLHPAGALESEWVFGAKNRVGVCDGRVHRPDLSVFNGLGRQYVEAARPGGLLVMDELGFLEAQAERFTAAVLRALAGDIPIIAAVKSRKDVPFLNAVRSAPKAEVFHITPENRNELYNRLRPRIAALTVLRNTR